jgi:hypothetical protein
VRIPEEGQVTVASAASTSDQAQNPTEETRSLRHVDDRHSGAQVGVVGDGDEDERLRMASTVPIEGLTVVELGCGTGLVR